MKWMKGLSWPIRFGIFLVALCIVCTLFEIMFMGLSEKQLSNPLDFYVEDCTYIDADKIMVKITNKDDYTGYADCYLLDENKKEIDCYLDTDLWEANKQKTYKTNEVLIPAKATIVVHMGIEKTESSGRPVYFKLDDEIYELQNR